MGTDQYTEMVNTRLVHKTVGLRDTIKKTNLELFPSILDTKRKQKKKDPSCVEHHRLMKIVEVSGERNVDLSEIGKYMLGDDSALSEDKGSKPFLGQSKAKVTSEYLMPNFPSAFSCERPEVDITIYDHQVLNYFYLERKKKN